MALAWNVYPLIKDVKDILHRCNFMNRDIVSSLCMASRYNLKYTKNREYIIASTFTHKQINITKTSSSQPQIMNRIKSKMIKKIYNRLHTPKPVSIVLIFICHFCPNICMCKLNQSMNISIRTAVNESFIKRQYSSF